MSDIFLIQTIVSMAAHMPWPVITWYSFFCTATCNSAMLIISPTLTLISVSSYCWFSCWSILYKDINHRSTFSVGVHLSETLLQLLLLFLFFLLFLLSFLLKRVFSFNCGLINLVCRQSLMVVFLFFLLFFKVTNITAISHLHFRCSLDHLLLTSTRNRLGRYQIS
jgi:hypothetical protein